MALDFEGCSVDRIDNNGHYELKNMQLISLAENISKDKTKAKNGYCECYSCFNTKKLEHFTKCKRNRNGYATICLECDRLRYHDRKRKAK